MPSQVTLLQFNAAQLVSPAGIQATVINGRACIPFNPLVSNSLFTNPVIMPRNYAGNPLKANLYYMMATVVTGDIHPAVAVEAITPEDALDLDAATSFDTINNATDTVPGTTAGKLGLATVTLTNADSVAVGDLVRFKVQRSGDELDDTANDICYVLGLEIWEDIP